MNVQPVIHRELRAACRRKETWRLRLVFGVGAVLAFIFGLVVPASPREQGQVILVSLSVAGFVLSLFAGAYLTADAVSAEKREGTLGLLFLTPLRGWELVIGKMGMHSVQVGFALLGGFPFFFLPVLIGGVEWAEVVRILLALVLTLGVSLACGMFYSTVLREARSAVLATAITMPALTLLPWLPDMIGEITGHWSTPSGTQFSPMSALIFAFDAFYRSSGPPRPWTGSFIYWSSCAWLAFFTLALVAVSGWLLPRVWRKAEAGEGRSVEPGLRAIRRRKAIPRWAPSMDKAPLIWLAARDLREGAWLKIIRLILLGLFVIMLICSAVVKISNDELLFVVAFCACYAVHLMTRVQLLLAGTNCFHRDRQSGALEAILVTPVEDADLLRAHHESLGRSFRGHLLTLLAMNLALEIVVFACFRKLNMQHGAWAAFTVFFVGGAVLTIADLCAIRWMALRESLKKQSQIKAAGRTFFLLNVIPWLAFAVACAVAIPINADRHLALVFAGWAAACLAYKLALIAYCRRTLRGGFRRLAAQA